MPLDSGGMLNLHLRADGDRDPDLSESLTPSLDTGPDIGAALRTAREFRGLSLQDLADSTRIRRGYLAAVEEGRYEDLPSRPFAIGYIRAYASALGLDGEAAVRRFKDDEPVRDEPLRAPVGVRDRGDPRLTAVIVIGLVIVAAIVLWNIAQRAMSESAPPVSNTPEAAMATPTPSPAATGPLSLGAPLPAPVESTTPTPYETPGLQAAAAAGGSADAVTAAARLAANQAKDQPPPPPPVMPQTFTPQGAVYGVPASEGVVVFQALKPTSIILRGADGSVYFARQLAAGEAYRAPLLKGLMVDVSAADAVQTFVRGQSKGVLAPVPTAVTRLAADE